VLVGITVPVLDMDDAEDESSSYSGGSSGKNSGGGKDDSFVLAKCFARSDMAARMSMVCSSVVGVLEGGLVLVDLVWARSGHVVSTWQIQGQFPGRVGWR
jgi:hypothetical protein